MDKTEEQYEDEFNQIDKMFPNANFTISIDIEKIDTIITKKTNIIIKNTYTCYCYDNNKKNTEYYHITGENITNKYIINKLIEQGLTLDCNHRFLEGFIKIPNSDCQFEMFLGS